MPYLTALSIGTIKSEILTPVVSLLFAVAVLYFVFGVIQFIRNSASAEKRADGAKHLMYGIFGLFIMVSVYGLMGIVCKTVQCDGNTTQSAP
jgi:hypothetical protein